MVADVLRTVPPAPDLIKVLRGSSADVSWDQGEEGLSYPVLLVSHGCAMCFPAKNYWSKVADELGVDLQVIVVEEDYELTNRYNASGYPCLITGPDQYHYGVHRSHDEAKRLLRSSSP